MPYHIRRMKHHYPTVFRYIQICALLITATLSPGLNTQLFGQICNGTYKTIFKETFGHGTDYGPNLTYDAGAGTNLLNGVTSYIYWDPNTTCGYPSQSPTCHPDVEDNWYTIASSPVKGKSDWINIADHTGDPNGKMLIVNAAPKEPSTFYRRRVRNICQNTLITFSAWFVEVNGPSSFQICSGEPNGEPRVADVAFIIRDTLGNTIDTVRTGPIHAKADGSQTWAQYSKSFYTGPNTAVDVSLVNRAPGDCGNDLAIDDIEFDACVPTFTALPPNGSVCLNNNVNFSSHLNGSYNPPVIRWYSSKDNGVTWNPVPGGNDSILAVYNVQLSDNGTLYRAIAAGSLADILSAGTANSCSVTSNSAPLKITQDNVSFGPIPSICQSSGKVDLRKYVSTYNTQSSFSGNGVDSVFFDPLKVLQGSTTSVDYSYINSGTLCQTDVKTLITVIAAPIPRITTRYGDQACAGKAVEMDLSGPGVDASDDIKWYDSSGALVGFGLIYYAPVSGTYTAVVTSPGGCVGTAKQKGTINPLPGSTINQGTGSKICAGGSVTLTTSTPGVSNQWTYNNKSVIFKNKSSIVVTKDGLYTLAVTNASGCSDSTSYYLTVNPLPLPKIAYLTSTTFCPGGVINFDAASFNNGLSTYVSFQWLNNGVAIPNATTKSYLATTGGSYTLQVTDMNGCTGISPPVVITIKPTPPTPLISASGPLTTCKGTPLSLTVTNYNAKYFYQWQQNGFSLPSTNVQTYYPQVSATYTVLAQDTSTKCYIESASVAVTINPVPVASVGFTTLSICTNNNAAHDQITLTPQVSPVGSYTYQWYMNGVASGSPTTSSTYAAKATGQYYFTATSAGGCTGTALPVQVTISSSPKPVIQPSANFSASFCNPLPGFTYLELVPGATYNSYQWYLNGAIIQGDTSAEVRATADGKYQLQVVNADGCSGLSDPLIVTAYPAVTPLLTPTSLPGALCQGETQLLTAKEPGTLQWWNGNVLLNAPGSSITVSTPGRYYYTLTDKNGCHSTSNVVAVQVHANPPANIYAKSTSGVLKFCTGELNALTLHMYDVYPVDSATFEWHHINPVSNKDSVVQSAVLNDSTYAVGNNSAKDPGNYYVKVTYVPAGCSAKSNVINVQFDKPPVSSLGGGIICTPGPVVLTSPPGTLFAWEYSSSDSPLNWVPAPGPTAKNTKYNATAPGFYRVHVTDDKNCGNYTDTLRLTEGHHLAVAVTPASATICKGSFTQFAATITSGGPADPTGTFYTYHWFRNGVPAPGGAFNTIGADSAGSWTVHVDRPGYCTGIASGTLVVNTPAKPVLSPSPLIVACEGTIQTLTVSNAPKFTTYTWLRNLFPIIGYTNTPSSSYPVSQFGDYRVIGTDASNGCTDTSTVTTVNYQKVPHPQIYTTGPTRFCEGGSTQIYVDSTTASGKPGTDTFQWAVSTTTSAGPFTLIPTGKYARLTVNAPGYYQVTETTSSGCIGTAIQPIQTFPVTTPKITGSSHLCDSSTTTLSSNITTPGEFEWDYATVGNFISGQTPIAVSQPGVYYLVSKNTSNPNCIKTTSITVIVDPLPKASYVMADSCQTTNSVTFVNQSSISDGTVLTSSWNFGDPGSGVNNTATSTTSAPGVHVYPSPVTPVKYPVTLTVTSAAGCTRSYKQSFLFKGARPVASFTAGGVGPICASQPLLLADNSTITTGTIVSYAWSIYNAAGNHVPIAIDSIAAPTVKLPDSTKSAVYTIFHTVIGNSGCLDITSKSITVSGALKAQLRLLTTQVCTTTAPDSLRGGTPKNGYSNIVGAYSGTGVKAGIFYPGIAGVGKFQITYTIVDKTTGCSSFATDSINVAQGPAAAKLSAPATYKPCDTSVLLTAKGTGAVLYSFYYKLASGKDSLLRSGPLDTLSTSTSGNYFVRISNVFGCYTDATLPITIYPHPRPAFALAEVCSNLVSTFTNTSTISDKSTMKYQWDFGDPSSGANNTTTSPVPVHQFSSTGSYTVTLTATSTKGCTQSLAHQFMINNLDSLVNFTINTNAPYCMSEPVVFIDSTVIPDRTILSYRWIFLDAAGNVLHLTSDTTGIVSVIFPPVTTPTKFTVREMVITTDNCPLMSKDRMITINPVTPVTYVREHPRNVCRLDPPFPLTGGETVPPGQAGKGSYSGDGVMNGSTFNPLKVLGGDNTVSYVFTNQYGCVSTASTVYTVNDTLVLSPKVTNFNVLEGDLVSLNGVGTLPFIFGPNYVTSLTADSLKWAWTPATGLSSTSVPVPTLTAGVTTTYLLTVTPPDGCPSRAIFVVVVHKRLHIPNAFSPNGDGINDPWIIQGIDSYPTAEVFIFNRWGQQLWYSKGYGTPWNGFYNGKPLPMGTYYYLIKLNKKGYEQPLSGPLTLIY